jgi:rhodanese-related sulfurtransferase
MFMSKQLSVQEAHGMLNNSAEPCILVDVRSKAEFNSLHAEPALHIPLEELAHPSKLELLKGKKILCICQSGMRGKKAVEELTALGLQDVQNVEGGTTAWKNAQLPVIEGKQSISIERQVRIAAGLLVLIGTLAGIFMSSSYLAIPLFVGAGLVFAGVTDTCGMALVLARCPWNS